MCAASEPINTHRRSISVVPDSTLTPPVATPTGGSTRAGPSTQSALQVYMSGIDRLILVQLCVSNRAEYSLKRGTKGLFWVKVGPVLREQPPEQLKDPGTTMKTMATVFDRRSAKRRKAKVLGTA